MAENTKRGPLSWENICSKLTNNFFQSKQGGFLCSQNALRLLNIKRAFDIKSLEKKSISANKTQKSLLLQA